jgi:hypothetical protein
VNTLFGLSRESDEAHVYSASGCRRSRSCCTLQWLVSIVDSARQIRRKDSVPLAINDEVVTERVSSPPVGPSTPSREARALLYWVVSSLNPVSISADSVKPEQAHPSGATENTLLCYLCNGASTVHTPYSLWRPISSEGPPGQIVSRFHSIRCIRYRAAPLSEDSATASKSKKRRIDFFLFSRLGLLATGCGTRRVLCSVRFSRIALAVAALSCIPLQLGSNDFLARLTRPIRARLPARRYQSGAFGPAFVGRPA